MWIVAAQPQVGPPVTKHPPIPITTGNIVPVVPPLPFKAKWNLALPQSLHVMVAAGTDEFFVGSDAGTISAHAVADAHEVWVAPVAAEMLAAGDGLVFAFDGKDVHALDQTTGNKHWSIATGPLATAMTWLPGWLLTQAKDGIVAAWRVSDGQKIWQQALSAPASFPLAVDGNRLFAPLADRRLVCLNIEDGAVVWSIELDGIGRQPTAAAGRVFFGTSNWTFYSVKQEKGQLEWPPHRMIRTTIIGRPMLDERYIWIATLDNKIQALSRSNGQIEIRRALTSRPAEQFVISGGQVIVPLTSGEIVMFNQKDGVPMPSPTAPLVPGSPAALAAAAAAAARAAALAAAAAATSTTATPPPATAPTPGSPPAPGAGATAGAIPPPLVVAQPAPGTKLAPPLVVAGTPDAPVILRITLDAGSGHIVTSFEREKKPPPTAPAEPAPTPPPAAP